MCHMGSRFYLLDVRHAFCFSSMREHTKKVKSCIRLKYGKYRLVPSLNRTEKHVKAAFPSPKGSDRESRRACLIEASRFHSDLEKMAFEVVERKGEGEWNYHEDAIIDVFQEDPSPPPQTSVKCTG